MKSSTFRLLAASTCLAVCLQAPAAPPPVSSVTVQGVLQTGDFFGAPGNGDNPSSDKVETVYYLQLPAALAKQVHPAGLLAAFSAPAQNASFVQLTVFDEEQSVARSLVGKRVRIIGTVVEPDAPAGAPHRTPAQIQVKSLSAIRDWQW
jgi:hypothetical protein